MGSHLLVAIVLSTLPLTQVQTAPAGTGAQASAQDGSQGPITITGKKDPKKKVVCETLVETGSVIPKRRCSTLAELEERRARDRATAERLKEELNRQREARRMICLRTGKC